MIYSKHISIYSVLIAGIIFSACQTPEQRVNSAEEKVQDAKLDSTMLQKSDSSQANYSANAEQWRSFKAEAKFFKTCSSYELTSTLYFVNNATSYIISTLVGSGILNLK